MPCSCEPTTPIASRAAAGRATLRAHHRRQLARTAGGISRDRGAAPDPGPGPRDSVQLAAASRSPARAVSTCSPARARSGSRPCRAARGRWCSSISPPPRPARYAHSSHASASSARGRVLGDRARRASCGAPGEPFDLGISRSAVRAGCPRGVPAVARAGPVADRGRRGFTWKTSARAGAPVLPVGWELLKSKSAGEVGYHLARAPA